MPQLALSELPASGIATLSGLLTGYIYNLDALPIPPTPFTRRRLLKPLKAYRIPSSLSALLSRVFRPLIGSAAAPRRAHRVLPGQTNESQLRAQAGALAALLGGRIGMGGTGMPGGAAGVRVRRRANGAAVVVPPIETDPVVPVTPARSPVDAVRGGTQVAAAAVGEWVSELAGGEGARAPTETEIAA